MVKIMPQYFITYLGGNQPSSPEEGKQHFAKYQEWLSSLGDAAVSPANPLKNTNTVSADVLLPLVVKPQCLVLP